MEICWKPGCKSQPIIFIAAPFARVLGLLQTQDYSARHGAVVVIKSSEARDLHFAANCRSLAPLGMTNSSGIYSFTFRKRSEFVITETELRLIAAAAKIGLSSSPKTG